MSKGMWLDWLSDRFPYRGIKDWVASCSVMFIAAQLLWYLSRQVSHIDILELPMVAPFFPFAALIDPHDGMVNSRDVFPLALSYWVGLFLFSLWLSRREINPAVPAAVVLAISSISGILYCF